MRQENHIYILQLVDELQTTGQTIRTYGRPAGGVCIRRLGTVIVVAVVATLLRSHMARIIVLRTVVLAVLTTGVVLVVGLVSGTMAM